jgi:hypothetical protein
VFSDHFSSTVATLVGMEVPELPNKEMVDYEVISKSAVVNVVYMFADYYIRRDDSVAVEFNFTTESVVF